MRVFVVLALAAAALAEPEADPALVYTSGLHAPLTYGGVGSVYRTPLTYGGVGSVYSTPLTYGGVGSAYSTPLTTPVVQRPVTYSAGPVYPTGVQTPVVYSTGLQRPCLCWS